MMNLTMLILGAFVQTVSPAPTNDDAARLYDRNGNYTGPTWKDETGRWRCRRSDGSAGIVVGTVGGATGTIFGQKIGGGSVTGSSITQGSVPRRRCR